MRGAIFSPLNISLKSAPLDNDETIQNNVFIGIRLRPGIATPPEEHQATATGDLHKIREDRSSGSRDMLADRQTDRRVDRNTWLPSRAD